MKRRILAIVLVLMLAVSLLPVSAMAEDEIYVSVGGKAFTSLNQTIRVGGGTATLSRPGEFLQLDLDRVNITQFDNLGSENGVTYYAGIAISGAYVEIAFHDCTITVPSHGANAFYDGIYSENVVSISGSLTIRNADVGIEAYEVHGSGATLSISTSTGPAIYAENYIDLINGTNNIQTSSNCAIVSGGFFRNTGTMTINHTPNCAKNGYDTVTSVAANYGLMLGNATINLKADLSGYRGSEPLLCSAAATSDSMSGEGNVTINMNVKGSENVVVEGVFANELNVDSGKSLTCHINLSGSHAGAVGIACGIYKTTSAGHFITTPSIESVITGAYEDDAAFYVESNGQITAKEIYASVDCDSAAAIMLNPACVNIYGGDGKTPLNIFTPKNGEFKTVSYDSGEFLTVADENGKPANVVVLSSRPYAFRDIDGKNDVYFKDAILWAVEQGITNGVSPVEFNPSGLCTRSQIVTLLWRAMGSPEPETAVNPFVDVKENSFYYKAVLWAYETELTKGTDATHFSPDAVCTRAEVVTFLWRNDGRPEHGISENPFTDISDKGQCSPYYDAILWAFENGITMGTNEDSFDPFGRCTRGQIVTFIYRDMAE